MLRTKACWIAGESVEGSGERHVVVDPATDTPVAELRLATIAEVDAAVAAARLAQKSWGTTTPAERSSVLAAFADAIDAAAEDLAQEEVAQTGKAVRLAREFDVPGSVDNARFFAGAARHLEGIHA